MNVKTQEGVRAALVTLEGHGFDVKEVWREFTRRVEAGERGVMPEGALRYVVPDEAPRIADHVTDWGEVRELAPHAMWKGYHYGLTPGQRRWFRENEDMTPARTVTLVWVECWPGTKALKAFKVDSDVHVDPQNRKHVLTSYVVRDATRFFDESAKYDNEEGNVTTLSLKVGKVNVWRASHKWAVADLCDVKLVGEVEIVYVSDLMIHFQDEGGKRVSVDRKEFLATVTDYQRLYKEGGGSGRKSTKATATTMEELMAEMERGIQV